MRFPFDLIAALLAVEAVRAEFRTASRAQAIAWGEVPFRTGETLVALLAFWVFVWLCHEGVTRWTEWQTRWGRLPQGSSDRGADPSRPRPKHPLEWHARLTLLAQAAALSLFVFFIWHYRWPLKTSAWPEWFGLERIFSPETVELLAQSSLAGALLDLGPYVIAMFLAWVPKRRLAQGFRRQKIPLIPWLSFEARLTFLPLVLWLVMAFVQDLGMAFTQQSGWSWSIPSWAAGLIGLLSLGFFALIAVPWLVVRLWQCQPLPDGELKARLHALLARSGVGARAILTWGPRGSGVANACVLGPWAPMRYILISPGLSDCLSLEECEAVVAHEIGHARHGHLALLVAMIIALSGVSGAVMRGAEWLGLDAPFAQAGLFLALLAVYIRVFFGSISRQCEREADLTSAELIGSPFPLVSALEKIAEMAGGIRYVYSWHHDSIAKRVERLQRDGLEPHAILQFHARVRRMRIALMVLAVVVVCLEFTVDVGLS